jgi:hypothetical protein
LQIATSNFTFLSKYSPSVFYPALCNLFYRILAGFSIKEIGILAASSGYPVCSRGKLTGYFADKVGRITSIVESAPLLQLPPFAYGHLWQNWYICSTILEALGLLAGQEKLYSHSSNRQKKQEHEYTKVLKPKTQSISLIANAILLALVPMTYAINPRYPFMIGTIAYLSLFTFALFMHDVTRSTSVTKLKVPDFHKITGKRNLLLFGLTFGIVSALYSAPTDMFNVALREYGIRPEHLGWIFGLSSVVGAIIGPFIHYLRKIKISSFLLIDLGVLLSIYLASSTSSAILLASAMIIGVGSAATAGSSIRVTS